MWRTTRNDTKPSPVPTYIGQSENVNVEGTNILPNASTAVFPLLQELFPEQNNAGLVARIDNTCAEVKVETRFEVFKKCLQERRMKDPDSDKDLSNQLYGVDDVSMQYYEQQLRGNGATYLVQQANNDIVPESIKITTDEVMFQIQMSKFVSNLGVTDQNAFANILGRIHDLYISDKSKSIEKKCRYPSTRREFRKLYTEYNTSINNKLPRPQVRLRGVHSYLSIGECISHTMLNCDDNIADVGTWVKTNIKENSIFNCPRIKEIVNNAKIRYKDQPSLFLIPVIPLFLIIWSDDFDPNTSSKKNRKSIWIKTMTLFYMNDTGERISTTFPICFGPKGSNHDDVEELLYNELRSLSTGKPSMMFNLKLQSPVMVHCEIFCVLMDQLERRSVFKLMAGNSIMHSQWGTMYDCNSNVNIIRSCKNCTESIESEIEYLQKNIRRNGNVSFEWRETECQKCTAWLFHKKHKLLKYKPEEGFPKEYCDDKGMIGPITVNFEQLSQVVDYLHENYIKENLAKGDALILLKYFGIDAKTVIEIMRCADNALKLRKAESERENDPVTYKNLLEDKKENEKSFEKFVVPHCWGYYKNTKLLVDAPMHLLFLGIMKAVCIDIQDWLKLKGLNERFARMCKGILEEIQQLNLNWCKIMPYKKEKFGGWVSENFLGFCRILDWFYVLLIRLPEETVYKDPVSEPSAWYKKENEAWLGARGFPNKGTAAELRIQVSKLLERDPVPEIITKHICSYRHILEMLHTLKTTISTCMKLKVEEHDIINLEALTRKFLILYDRMDKSMKAAKNGKPGWITQYNFMSLLNIPDVMRNYGSMRNLWEGGEEGEGILRIVKPEIKIGMRGNWPEWLMSNLLKIKSYETVIAREETIPQLPEGEAATSQETQDPVDYKIYGTPEKAEAVINTGRPFSGLRLEVEKAYKYYVCYRQQKKIYGKEIEFSTNYTLKNYHQYYKVRIAGNVLEINKDNTKGIGVLFLPILGDTGYPEVRENRNYSYCIIKSNWEEN